jgi:O-methyltransferase
VPQINRVRPVFPKRGAEQVKRSIVKRAFEIAHSGHVVAPTILSFVFGPSGADYNLGPAHKLDLLGRCLRNSQQAGSSTTFGEHVALVDAILTVPREMEGDVAEFGCYKGMSTASLSAACKATNRRLVVFDSFRGLPPPTERVFNFGGNEVVYEEGSFAGTLEEVKRNVGRFGELSVCEFVPGFFSDTLPGRPAGERFVMIFEDADLPTSVRDVLRFAWPKLREKCRFFTQEARDREVMELFFDRTWWSENLRERAPGVVGSGVGLPLGRAGSGLAYAIRSGEVG